MQDERRQALEGLVEVSRETALALMEINPSDPWINASLEIASNAARTLERHSRRQEGRVEPGPDLSWREPFDHFDQLPEDVQERLVLEALGDKAMTTMEITAAIQEISPQCRPGSSRSFAERLFRGGVLGREAGRWGPCRYRYFAASSNATLHDLEQAFAAPASQ